MKKNLLWVALGALQLGLTQVAYADCTTSTVGSDHPIGDVYIPQDAPVGSTIGLDKYLRYPVLTCATTPAFRLEALMTGAKVSTIPVAVGGVVGSNLYQTNVPGIGIAMINEFSPDFICRVGSSSVFPMTWNSCGTSTVGRSVYNAMYLVKTGPIPPGVHTFDGSALYRINMIREGSTYDWVVGTVSGSVTVAGCSLPEGVGSIIDVPMKNWERRAFNGQGSKTPVQDFRIVLNNCIAGSYAGNPTWNYFQGNTAHIRLDGAKGSAILDGAQGMLGLNAEATTSEVAVQILKKDGSPMPLGIEVPMMPVQDGNTALEFGARYVQIEGGPMGPAPGKATATVNFTITYK